MFTGIVQATGVVRSVHRGAASMRLVLDAPALIRPIADGASICVSGVCLTVALSDKSRIEFDVVPETLSRSTLRDLGAGDRVNLERSLRLGDPMDGHVVQGHVDGVARVVRLDSGPAGHVVTFDALSELMAYIIPKGSIALDGVSLTVASVEGNTFSVALIPTTLSWTTLGSLRSGSRVNVETDILARTVVATMRRMQAADSAPREPMPGLSVEMLKENGW